MGIFYLSVFITVVIIIVFWAKACCNFLDLPSTPFSLELPPFKPFLHLPLFRREWPAKNVKGDVLQSTPKKKNKMCVCYVLFQFDSLFPRVPPFTLWWSVKRGTESCYGLFMCIFIKPCPRVIFIAVITSMATCFFILIMIFGMYSVYRSPFLSYSKWNAIGTADFVTASPRLSWLHGAPSCRVS